MRVRYGMFCSPDILAGKTQRSILIPSGMIMHTKEIEHEDKWATFVDGVVTAKVELGS